MEFLTDKFSFKKQKLLTSSAPMNLTDATSISGFEIGGLEPTGSRRKILFKVDDEYFKFIGNDLIKLNLSAENENADDVLHFGNSVAELNAVTNIPSWCGKEIFPIVALDFDATSSDRPTINLAVKVRNFTDVLQTYEVSEIFSLGDNARFLSVVFEKSVTGGGNVSMQVRLLRDEIWTDWLEISTAANLTCQAVQLRAIYSVTNSAGTSSASVSNAKIVYAPFAENVSCETTAIFLREDDFELDLMTCYVLVRHSELFDNDLKCFVHFDDLPLEQIQDIGTGNGATQIFELDEGIDPDSFLVKVDGLKTFDFEADFKDKTLKISAPTGKKIRVEYNYNLAQENWIELEKQFTMFDKNFQTGKFVSRFVCRLDKAKNSKVGKVKILSEVLTGSETETFTAVGGEQTVCLKHFPVDLDVNAKIVSREKNLLTFNAAQGATVSVKYDWVGLPLNFFKVAAGFSE